MIKCRAWFFIIIFLMGISIKLNALDYFVDGSLTGIDTNTGTAASPFHTIQKAATAAKAGSTVYIRQGIYRESVTPKYSGTNNTTLLITYRPYTTNDVVTINGTTLLS